MAFLKSTSIWFVLRCVGAFIGATLSAAHAQDNAFLALCYHEVESDATASISRTAVHASDLAAQFAWLDANHYHPVSLQQIIDARNGGQHLPDKAVLLTFDDGKKDVYTRAFPLLKLFHYPAVVALVGSWLEVPEGQMVDYDGNVLPRDQFVSWEDVRAMQQSGLVEVASHSYALHRGLLANPQGNTQPAATTRRYTDGQYESDQQYLLRLTQDIVQNRDLILQKIGQPPRAIVWPYGRSNLAAQDVAAKNGQVIGMTLIDGINTPQVPLSQIKRHIIEQSPSLQSFAEAVRHTWASDPARSVWVHPAQWEQIEAGLSGTLDQLQRLAVNISFVDPRYGPVSDESILFKSEKKIAQRDELNRIAWQIERRGGSAVLITIPDNWLDDAQLLGELARSVNFAGVRLPLAPGDPRARKVINALSQWTWPIRVAYAPKTVDITDTLWSQMEPTDLLIVPWSNFSSRSIPVQQSRHMLIEFDPRVDTNIATHMRQLESLGYVQFGVAMLPMDPTDPVWRALSLRSQPLLP